MACQRLGVPCGVTGLNTNCDTCETRRCTEGDLCGVTRHVLGGGRAGERAGDTRAVPVRARRASFSRCSCWYCLSRIDSRLASSSTWRWLASSCRELLASCRELFASSLSSCSFAASTLLCGNGDPVSHHMKRPSQALPLHREQAHLKRNSVL